MAKTSFSSIDEYIASQPKAVRPVLTAVRATIRKAMPKAEEGISYQMPTFKVAGHPAIYFAGWKEHFSLYPSTEPLLAEFGEELAPYTISKGTIRFPLSEPVPVRLIGRIARFRAKEAAEREAARAAAKAAKKAR